MTKYNFCLKQNRKNFGPNWALSRPVGLNSWHQEKRMLRKIWKQNVSYNGKSEAGDLRVEAY